MKQIRSSKVRGSGGLALAVYEQGPRDRPAIVLVHGHPDTHSVWDGVAERLAERLRVIRYDVRGAGASEVPRSREGYRMMHLASDLRAVIDATCHGKTAHVVGHDWGSIQAWEAVTDHDAARHVASFTTMSGPCLDHVGLGMKEGLRDPLGAARQAARSWYIYSFHVPFLAPMLWRSVLGRTWPRVMERTEGLRGEDTIPTSLRAEAGARGVELYRANVFRHVTRPRERHATVPVQLIELTRDRYVGKELLVGVERWAPKLERVTIDGGHWHLLRDPEAIAAHVARFVDRLEGTATSARTA